MSSLSVIALGLALGAGPDAEEVMRRVEQAGRFEDVVAEATFTTVAPDGASKARELTWLHKRTADGGARTLLRFRSPLEIKGEAVLVVEAPEGTVDISLWLPRLKKVRKVGAQGGGLALAGSAFRLSDLSTPRLGDFTHRLTGVVECPDGSKAPCHVVESTPKTDAVRERTGCAKQVHWVQGRAWLEVQVDCLAADGTLVRRLTTRGIRELKSKAGRRVAAQLIRVEEPATRRSATLEFRGGTLDAGTPDAAFTEEGLKQAEN